MKKGWVLLGVSFVMAFVGLAVLGYLGGMINAEADDYYGQIGAVIGFLAPSIIYFGNRL